MRRLIKFKMKLLIIDCETTNTHENNGELIEIAAILFDVETRSVLSQVSTLLPVKAHGMEECHGIKESVCNLCTPNIYKAALNMIIHMDTESDYAVAHNAAFDREFTKWIESHWLCTYNDFRFPPHKPQRLIDLALAHGIAIKSAHRALTDCGLIAEILAKRDDLEELIKVAIARSRSPLVEVKAIVDYDNRDKASKARFNWDGQRKGWFKTVKECDLDDITGVDWVRV